MQLFILLLDHCTVVRNVFIVFIIKRLMEISGIVLIVGVFVLLIWFFLVFRRARHKFFSHFLLVLLIFLFITFAISIRGSDVSFKTSSGVLSAGKIYFNWLGSAFGNVKSITGYATKLDWDNSNETSKKK